MNLTMEDPCFLSSNSSNVSGFSDQEKKSLYLLHHILYELVVPIVCSFGFLGNILNVIIFTKKKSSGVMDDIEYCTTICLVSLAISDMMFCLSTFPNAFLSSTQRIFSHHGFWLFYKMYSPSLINTFILSSTMLTVLTALMRYLAICHPFHSRQAISVKTMIAAILIIVALSIAFSTPFLWTFKTIKCLSEERVQVTRNDLFVNKKFNYSYKLFLAIFGNFIPLAILMYCNIQLIRALRLSRQLRLLHSRDDTRCLSEHRRINITLITIIVFFFFLVAPSEITKFIFLLTQGNKNSYTFYVVSFLTNTLQCINFSINFILYYVIIAPFRHAFHGIFCLLTRSSGPRTNHKGSSPNNTGKQTVMLLSLKDHKQNNCP